MTDWIDYIPELHAKLVKQNFGPNDSQIVSSIMHPAEAINRGGEWIRHNVSQAAGGDPYDNQNPLYGPSREQQAEAGFNIAGLAQLGSMPGSPKSSGGTLGTSINKKLDSSDFIELYHGGDKPIIDIDSREPYRSLFASGSETNAYGHGKKLTKILYVYLLMLL